MKKFATFSGYTSSHISQVTGGKENPGPPFLRLAQMWIDRNRPDSHEEFFERFYRLGKTRKDFMEDVMGFAERADFGDGDREMIPESPSRFIAIVENIRHKVPSARCAVTGVETETGKFGKHDNFLLYDQFYYVYSEVTLTPAKGSIRNLWWHEDVTLNLRPHVVNDLRMLDHPRARVLVERGLLSSANTPIVSRGECIAQIILYSKTAGVYGPEEIACVKKGASELAPFIRHTTGAAQ